MIGRARGRLARLRGRIGRTTVMAVLIPAVLVAAAALAYYSYRYAQELARRGEQSIVDTNRDLAEGTVKRIEQIIVESDRTLFDLALADPRNLREFARRWADIARFPAAIESAIILDDRLQIMPDGYVSKKRRKVDVEHFRQLFEQALLPRLDLAGLPEDAHRHLHEEIGGRYYLLSYTRRTFEGRSYYVVLEADLAFIVGEVIPESFGGIDARRLYQVVDEQDRIVFGHPFAGVPTKYVVEVPLHRTLYKWRVRMAPREAPALLARETAQRASDVVLIGLSAATIFVGMGVLWLAIRAEQRASQLKSDFIANVSHELKTPLSLIRMFAELLATGRTKGPDTAREYAEIITRESDRLSRLIDNVLDFARIERGKVAYDFQIGDLGEVLSRGLDVYRYRLEGEGMQLVVDLAEDLPPVRMDENALTLVLLNLIDNAVKYAASGKELRVALRREPHGSGDERVLVQVTDRGPGIPVEERKLIFQRFYRAKDVRGRSLRGSGIGLSLVKHIAEAHGGGVRVDGRPGEGTTFTVWLPAATDVEGHPGEGQDDGSRDAVGGEPAGGTLPSSRQTEGVAS